MKRPARLLILAALLLLVSSPGWLFITPSCDMMGRNQERRE